MHRSLTAAALYRLLPSLDKILQSPELQGALSRYPRWVAVRSGREALDRIRSEIGVGNLDEAAVRQQVSELPKTIASDIERSSKFSLQRVINATGVVLHTNLGRAPLSLSALDRVCEVAGDYSNLELDLESGSRSRRDVHAESLVLRTLAMKAGVEHGGESGGHSVLVANNCAAATFLVLNSLADGREVIVSRGELVEIGGGFRIPEILRKSGATLREVGTTNRTRLADYQEALSDRTALILRVHQSNFQIQGFAERPRLEALTALARKTRVPLFEDQGTGLLDTVESSSDADSSFARSFKEAPDVIAASGDKLLGGPQCGIIVGKQDLIRIVSKNPLMRAFRVCKLTYAALSGTLMDYLTENERSIPVVRMLALRPEEILIRCEQLAASVPSGNLQLEVVPSKGLIGGGTTPGKKLNSFAVAVRHPSIPSAQLARLLRQGTPPIISRIQNDRILLDLRTVPPESDGLISRALSSIEPETEELNHDARY